MEITRKRYTVSQPSQIFFSLLRFGSNELRSLNSDEYPESSLATPIQPISPFTDFWQQHIQSLPGVHRATQLLAGIGRTMSQSPLIRYPAHVLSWPIQHSREVSTGLASLVGLAALSGIALEWYMNSPGGRRAYLQAAQRSNLAAVVSAVYGGDKVDKTFVEDGTLGRFGLIPHITIARTAEQAGDFQRTLNASGKSGETIIRESPFQQDNIHLQPDGRYVVFLSVHSLSHAGLKDKYGNLVQAQNIHELTGEPRPRTVQERASLLLNSLLGIQNVYRTRDENNTMLHNLGLWLEQQPYDSIVMTVRLAENDTIEKHVDATLDAANEVIIPAQELTGYFERHGMQVSYVAVDGFGHHQGAWGDLKSLIFALGADRSNNVTGTSTSLEKVLQGIHVLLLDPIAQRVRGEAEGNIKLYSKIEYEQAVSEGVIGNNRVIVVLNRTNNEN